MKQSFVIIGLGRFGGSICRTLVESGQEVLAIDSSEDRVNEYMNIATHAVVANAQDEMTLRSLGIRNFDRVVHPERDMGQRIAHNLVSKNILDYLELSDEFSLAEINVTNRKFYGKTLDELDFRQRFGLNVVAIRRDNQDPIVTPPAEEVVQKDDHLVVIGRDEDVDYLDEKMNG